MFGRLRLSPPIGVASSPRPAKQGFAASFPKFVPVLELPPLRFIYRSDAGLVEPPQSDFPLM